MYFETPSATCILVLSNYNSFCKLGSFNSISIYNTASFTWINWYGLLYIKILQRYYKEHRRGEMSHTGHLEMSLLLKIMPPLISITKCHFNK